MYTIAAILGDVLLPYTKEILEVLNHCRFDKMKPVREAAIEAINLIKEIDPSAVEETQSLDSSTRKDKNSRGPPKPWKKKNKKDSEPASFAVFNSKEEEQPEGKISLATQKRREAQEAKKKNQPTNKPNLNKEKKSIFAQKKNPNFFKPNGIKEEPKVDIVMKEPEESKVSQISTLKQSSPKKSHNFYYQDHNMEGTPDFHDEEASEEEKRMELSNEKSNDSHPKPSDKKKPIMTFNLNIDDYEEDEEEGEQMQLHVQQKSKKHKFSAAEEDRNDIDEHEILENQAKVEETPEEEQEEENTFVVKEKPRLSNQRKYKAWERSADQTPKKEEPEPEQVYNTIADRIRNRNINSQKEDQKYKNLQKETPVYIEPKSEVIRQSQQSLVKSIDEDNKEMMDRLQNLKNQCEDIETNMEKMRESSSKPFFQENTQFIPNNRHTMNVPPASYYREEFTEPKPNDFLYKESMAFKSRSANIRNPQFGISNEYIDLSRESQSRDIHSREIGRIDLSSRDMHQRSYDNTPSQRSQTETNQIAQLMEEIRYMKSQQDKILENQNIFQTYISNEITILKNKMNQMESDMLLHSLSSKSMINKAGYMGSQ